MKLGKNIPYEYKPCRAVFEYYLRHKISDNASRLIIKAIRSSTHEHINNLLFINYKL